MWSSAFVVNGSLADKYYMFDWQLLHFVVSLLVNIWKLMWSSAFVVNGSLADNYYILENLLLFAVYLMDFYWLLLGYILCHVLSWQLNVWCEDVPPCWMDLMLWTLFQFICWGERFVYSRFLFFLMMSCLGIDTYNVFYP